MKFFFIFLFCLPLAYAEGFAITPSTLSFDNLSLNETYAAEILIFGSPQQVKIKVPQAEQEEWLIEEAEFEIAEQPLVKNISFKVLHYPEEKDQQRLIILEPVKEGNLLPALALKVDLHFKEQARQVKISAKEYPETTELQQELKKSTSKYNYWTIGILIGIAVLAMIGVSQWTKRSGQRAPPATFKKRKTNHKHTSMKKMRKQRGHKTSQYTSSGRRKR